jgi:hypothetical protein
VRSEIALLDRLRASFAPALPPDNIAVADARIAAVAGFLRRSTIYGRGDGRLGRFKKRRKTARSRADLTA